MTQQCRMSVAWGAIISVIQTLGCANPPQEMIGSDAAVNRAVAGQCVTSGNLLQDTHFSTGDGDVWVVAVHTGAPSFSISVVEGVLQLERIGPEPWMTYRQFVDVESKRSGKLVFSAELKGDLQSEPRLHAFKHIAGLWLQPGDSVRSALVAEHEPNDGIWEWQTVSMEADVMPETKKVVAGFIHQTGGTLWARNPSLIWTDC